MFNIVMTIVTKNNIPSVNAKFRSFFISKINVFSPEAEGANSVVTRRRMALTARSMLISWKVKGGSNIFTLLQYGTL